jgi:hypothetical protein
MNPNRGEAPANFELPPQPPSPEGEQGRERSAEAPAARPEKAGNQTQQPALPTIPDDIPVADQPVIAAPPQDLAAPLPADHQSDAQHGDRIEPQWVDKAKSIINQTAQDPFLQKDQMSRIKAEYIQKRFNKTIKTDETAS